MDKETIKGIVIVNTNEQLPKNIIDITCIILCLLALSLYLIVK